MSSRLSNMKWIVCLLVVYTGSVIWSPVESISVHPTPPKPKPARIEDQAKFFQDFFSVQLSPYKIEFGHVCEDPNNWEQRYEKKDFKNHRDMGKVRWGDKLGGYGEHYWDLNHAGHSDDHSDNGDHGDSYGSDHGYDDSDDSYDEPSESSPQYDSSEANNYEESPKYDNEDGNRNKRAHTRVKNQERSRKVYKKPKEEEQKEEIEETTESKEKLHTDHSHKVEKVRENEEERIPRVKPIKHKRSHLKRHKINQRVEPQEDEEGNESLRQEDSRQQDHRQHDSKQQELRQHESKQQDSRQHESRQQDSRHDTRKQDLIQQYPRQQNSRQQDDRQPDSRNHEQTVQEAEINEPTKYVAYEQGSGVRQHYHPELAEAASVPRLFWEPVTGRVVDRTTGQAYVLQPVAYNK